MELSGLARFFPLILKNSGVRFTSSLRQPCPEIDDVGALENGKVIARDRHAGLAGKPSREISTNFPFPEIHANNGCSLRAIHSVGGKSSMGNWN